jgi:predicted dehydrogenase
MENRSYDKDGLLRYGIIGCGSMGREHIENIKALGGTKITAISDTSNESITLALNLFESDVAVFENYQDLLNHEDCDIVVIATPNHTHAEILRAALKTKKHILTEKPVCTNIEDAYDLLKMSDGRKELVWVAQEYRYMPPVGEMIRMAHGGAVGVIHQVSIREHREPFYPKVGDWNRFSINTGGTLVEKCCHYFNLMDHILNEHPLRVFGSGAQRVNHLDERYNGKTPDILDSAYVIVEYPSGARAMLDLCMFAENSIDSEQIIIVGDQGKLESLLPSLTLRYGRREDWGSRKVWGEESGNEKGVSVRRIWNSNIKYPGQHFGASYIEHERFAHAVRHNLPAEVTLEDGLRSIATGIAAKVSIETGNAVHLDSLLPEALKGSKR